MLTAPLSLSSVQLEMPDKSSTYVFLAHGADPQFFIALPETLEETVQTAKDCFFLPEKSHVLLSFVWKDVDAVLTESSWEFFKILSKDSSHCHFRLTVRDVNECDGMAKRMKEKLQTQDAAEIGPTNDMKFLQGKTETTAPFNNGGSASVASSTTEDAPTLSLLLQSDDKLTEVATINSATDDFTPLNFVITHVQSGVLLMSKQNLATVMLEDLGARVDAFPDCGCGDSHSDEFSGSERLELSCPGVFKVANTADDSPSDNTTLGEWIRSLTHQPYFSDVELNEGLEKEGLHFTVICK